MNTALPIVSIVGRPNVGKSSLFNRLLGRRAAVVHETSGVTRDRNYQPVTWNERQFMLVDTGGMVPDSSRLMEKLILEQVEQAISESTLILFVVDALSGLTGPDEQIARFLQRKFRDRTVLVANKAEGPTGTGQVSEFLRLGLGEPFAVSASHGTNAADLLDAVALRVGVEAKAPGEKEIRIAVVGRPNAGKSSLVNMLCREKRVLVDEQPGTTRDSIDVHIEKNGHHYVLIDTAGMRKRAHVRDEVEYFSNLRVTKTIERCDIAMVMVDVKEGLSEQDQRVLHLAVKSGKGALLVLNKWDTVHREGKLFDKLVERIDGANPDFRNIPKVTISALTGLRVHRILEICYEIHTRCGQWIDARDLEDFMTRTFEATPPQSTGRYPVQVFSVTQDGVYPPTFIVHCNDPKRVLESYERFVRNRLLDRYSFSGCPIRVFWRARKKRKRKKHGVSMA